jgi:16S rRNA (guanine966-N2)-methyltransferase
VVERGNRGEAPTWPDGIVTDREKRYGETVLWYGHAAGSAEIPDKIPGDVLGEASETPDDSPAESED